MVSKIDWSRICSREEYELRSGEKLSMRERSLDLILAFDVTGSMAWCISEVRDDINYIAQGLTALSGGRNINIAMIGVGDHCDGFDMLQIKPYSSDYSTIRSNIYAIKNTGGGDTPEAYECLFNTLNKRDELTASRPILMLFGDSIPHNFKGYSQLSKDNGCPAGIIWHNALSNLKKKLHSFYFVSCGDKNGVRHLQKQMVDRDELIIELEEGQIGEVQDLANLVIALYISEVGDKPYLFYVLREQMAEKELLDLAYKAKLISYEQSQR